MLLIGISHHLFEITALSVPLHKLENSENVKWSFSKIKTQYPSMLAPLLTFGKFQEIQRLVELILVVTGSILPGASAVLSEIILLKSPFPSWLTDQILNKKSSPLAKAVFK